MDFSLTSLFSSFLTSGNPADALANARLQIEAAVGHFLMTGQQVSNLKTRADAQRNSSNSVVVQKAVALSSQASALLTEYGRLKDAATTLLNNIVDLKTRVESNPDQYADTGDGGTVYGWRVMDVLSKNKQAVLQATADGATMVRSLNAYETRVSALDNDVQSLENLAQGKGLQATLSTIGGAYAGIAKTGVTVGVAALAVYFLAPTFIPRMMKGLRSK